MEIDPWKSSDTDIHPTTSTTTTVTSSLGKQTSNGNLTYSSQSSPPSLHTTPLSQYGSIIPADQHQQQTQFIHHRQLGSTVTATSSSNHSNQASHIPDHRRFFYHDVKETDTLAGLAILYGIETSDLKQANNILGDTDLSMKKNIRIPREKCRISHIHLINDSGQNLGQERPMTLLNEKEEGSVEQSEQSTSKNTTANDLFAAIDMDMEQAMKNMQHVLEDSSLGTDHPNRGFFSSKLPSRSYRHSYHDLQEREALISGNSDTNTILNNSSNSDPDKRHSIGHQSIFQYTTRNGMYIDDSSVSISESRGNDTCNLIRLVKSWIRWMF